MKATDLDILLQEGEGVMLEYKEGLSSSFARQLVALANTAGGRTLLGVRDDGTGKGIADTNELRTRIQDIARNYDPPHIYRTCTPQVTHQVKTKSGLSKDQVQIIDKCLYNSQIGELMALAGRTNRTKFRDQVLNPLLEARFIEMTVPEKPSSSKQRYRTTAAGRAILEKHEKEAGA